MPRRLNVFPVNNKFIETILTFAHKKLLANQSRKEFPGMTGEIRGE